MPAKKGTGPGNGTETDVWLKSQELSTQTLQEIEEASAYLTIDLVADYLGIHRSTFYRMLQRSPEIARRYKKGRARKIMKIGSDLLTANDNAYVAGKIFYLKTKGGWKEDMDNEVPELENPDEERERKKEYEEFVAWRKMKQQENKDAE